MASQTYVDSVTLTAAAEFNKFDTAAYAALTGTAGTNTITATGPANYTLAATHPPVWFIPANTNTGATTLAITPSGGAALTAKNVFSGGAACVGGEIVANVPCAVVYDGTQYNILGTPQARNITWTPVLTFATPGDQSIAYAANGQIGRYSKIGNMVFVDFNIQTSTFTHGTASGNLQITGLPFAAITLTGYNALGSLTWQGITKANYTQVSPQIQSASSSIAFATAGSAQLASQISVGDVPTGGSVILQGSIAYRTA